MNTWEALAVLLAGAGAGAINTLVGSGTLFTFPVLLACGVPPVTAAISNSIGLTPGSVAGVVGYRRELAGQRSRVLRLGAMSLLGALTGATLLLNLPEKVFTSVAPVLILLACLLIVFQPRINAWTRARRAARPNGGPLLQLGVYGAGVYGGYFTAAQGVILISLLGSSLNDDMQRLNALKNVLASIVNASVAVYYLVFAQPNWIAAALIATGSVVGGYLGARFGRRLKPTGLRILVVLIGLTAAVQLVLR